MANSFIKSGAYKRILLAGTEVLSRFTDWEDRTTCVLFGDGAGAAILEATDEDRGNSLCTYEVRRRAVGTPAHAGRRLD